MLCSSVDAESFEERKKSLRVQIHPDTCGRGLACEYESTFTIVVSGRKNGRSWLQLTKYLQIVYWQSMIGSDFKLRTSPLIHFEASKIRNWTRSWWIRQTKTVTGYLLNFQHCEHVWKRNWSFHKHDHGRCFLQQTAKELHKPTAIYIGHWSQQQTDSLQRKTEPVVQGLVGCGCSRLRSRACDL